MFDWLNGGWENPNQVIPPGGGVMLGWPGDGPDPFQLSFSGELVVPPRRVPLPRGLSLLASQELAPARWEDIVDRPPKPGDHVYRWDGTKYIDHLYAASGWIPVEPVARVGAALFFATGDSGGIANAPVIVQGPASLTVAPGSPATFAVVATGAGPLTYAWYRDRVLVPGETTATLTLPSVSVADAGARFHVEVSNSIATVPSRRAELGVALLVTGRFLRPGGLPLADLEVRLRAPAPEGPMRGARTGADGRFRVFAPLSLAGVADVHLISPACPALAWTLPLGAAGVDFGELQCGEPFLPAAVPPNLGLWLTFNETNGPVANNHIGGNAGSFFDGTAVPGPDTGPQPQPGVFIGNSLRFDGVDDVVAVPTYPAAEVGAGDFSLALWIRPEFPSGDTRILVDKLSPTGEPATGYRLALRDRHLVLTLADGVAQEFADDSLAVPFDGGWRLVVVTVDRSEALGVRFFVDGAPSAARRDPRARRGSLANATPFTVGGPAPPRQLAVRRPGPRPASPGNEHWGGGLDEVSLFLRSLQAEEVASVAAAGPAGMSFANVRLTAVVPVCDPAEPVLLPIVLLNYYSGAAINALVRAYDLQGELCTVHVPRPPSFATTVPPGAETTEVEIDPAPLVQDVGAIACVGVEAESRGNWVEPLPRWRYEIVPPSDECASADPFATAATTERDGVITINLRNKAAAADGGPRTLNVQFIGQDPRSGDATNLRLNDQEFGAAFLTQVRLARGESTNLTLTARFARPDGGVFYPVYVRVAEAPDTNYHTIASAVVLNVLPGTRALRIVRSPRSQILPPGGTATFEVAITNELSAARFLWRRDGRPLFAATNAILTLPAVSAEDAGLYDVVVADREGALLSPPAVLGLSTLHAIELAREGERLELRWPQLFETWEVQNAASPDDRAGWRRLEGIPRRDAERFSLPVSPGAPAGFFRLRE